MAHLRIDSVCSTKLDFLWGGDNIFSTDWLQMAIDKNRILEELILALNAATNPNAFCKNLVHGLLIQEQAFAAHLLFLGDNSRIQVLGAYGYGDRETTELESSVWSDSPAAQAIRNKKSLGFEGENSDGSGSPSYHVVIPFLDSNVPVGCLGLEFAKPYSDDIIGEVFQGLFNLTGIAALNRFANREKPAVEEFAARAQQVPAPELVLSKRQLVVLSGMREELSNAQIAEQLHLSESSIKQETVRLFRALGVKNRAEARRIALERLVIN